MGQGAQETHFTLDTMGRLLCNSLSEATASTITVGGRQRMFDVIVIGGGTFGAMVASDLFFEDKTHSRRILVLEAGPLSISEHWQNLPYGPAVTPDFRVPWESHPALNYAGLLFAVGGRSVAWGGWSPQLLEEEMGNWPDSVKKDLFDTYFRYSSEQLGVTATNDFIYGRLHVGLRKQLFEGLNGTASSAMKLSELPDHPVFAYASEATTSPGAAAVSASASLGSPGAGAAPALALPPIEQLRSWLGLPQTDPTPYDELRNMLKLEAPLAVQARALPGSFPSNKFSAVPNLIRATRIASSEADGIDAPGDARKRIMVVPKCHVLDIITEMQPDNWVRATGVRVRDENGSIQEVFVRPPDSDGSQSAIVIALGTVESTRLAMSTFKESLGWRAAQRMGKNLIAHLRSNLYIRVPKSSLKFLPPSDRDNLETSALFVKGKTTVKVNGKTYDRRYHLQISASGLDRFGTDAEAELFRKIPDYDHVEQMLHATDTHVVIAIRGIGEMSPFNADSHIDLSPTSRDFDRPKAQVTMADVKTGQNISTDQSRVDMQTWEAMDKLADQVALIFANGQPFDVLSTAQGIVSLPSGATAADLQTAHPHPNRRDALGTTHHDAGTLWMGTDPAKSVTNDYGRIHDTTNCYVAAPALFPSLGSPNPMLTGVALARRTAELLNSSVLPAGRNFSPQKGFKPLFDGTVDSFNQWKLAGPSGGQGFAFLNGELVSYGSSDIALLYYAKQAFKDFHLSLQFRIFDPANANSGVFLRFADPTAPPSAEMLRRVRSNNENFNNRAVTAVYTGFEVQIDDNARGDKRRDFYGIPEPDGLWKNRTGAIYKIPAGDFIYHLGRYDRRDQNYTPGPRLVPGVWFQYDIIAKGDHYEVVLTNTATNEYQTTTTFDNPDKARGISPGLVGLQSYPNCEIAFRNVMIKEL